MITCSIKDVVIKGNKEWSKKKMCIKPTVVYNNNNNNNSNNNNNNIY